MRPFSYVNSTYTSLFVEYFIAPVIASIAVHFTGIRPCFWTKHTWLAVNFRSSYWEHYIRWIWWRVAVPGDSNVLQKETEKYQDLEREIKRIWKSRTKVVPVAVGALGSVSRRLAGHLEQLGIEYWTRSMQKSALLRSAHILRKVFEVRGLGMRLNWIFLRPVKHGQSINLID